MPDNTGSRHSIFSQRFDRVVFISYFLGGVVPMAALGWLVHHAVLPEADRLATLAWLGGLLALATLSLSVFFALRHVTSTTVAQMEGSNRRLASLLAASRAIGSESHADVILGHMLDHAGQILGAPAAVLYADQGGKELELSGPGTPELRDRLASLCELAEDAIAAGRPAGAGGVLAVPFGSSESGRGALLAPETAGSEVVDALGSLAGTGSTAIQRADLEAAQRNFFVFSTDLLVSALDAHVVGRDQHATEVARLSNLIGRALGFDAPTMERLHFAAMLHDIGMLKVPPERQQDPKALRHHPVLGARMLARIKLWEPVAPIVQSHHEWVDGSGYPEGLMGDAIPLEARVVAVADAVDAMRRGGNSRPQRNLPQILEELRSHSGSQFDPKVVEAFEGLVEQGQVELA